MDKKILFVSGLTGYGVGGARTEEIRLIGGAAARGANVAFCSDVLAPQLSGTPHFRLDYPPGPAAPRQLDAAISSFAPDVVHVVGGGIRFLEICDQRFKSLPWLFTAHNIPPAERIFSRWYGHPRLHYRMRDLLAIPSVSSWKRYLRAGRFSRAICHSQTVERRIHAAGCLPAKTAQIPFGSELDLSVLGDASHPPVFEEDAFPRMVTVAGLAHHKGQFDAIRMAAQLLTDYPRLSYRLIGMSRDKGYWTFLEQSIERLGLRDRVKILHNAPEAEKFAALREADLYIQPSREEGFCIAFLEAAMLSPRLLGCDTGAIGAMCAGDATARVVPPGDVGALRQAARDLLAMQVSPSLVEQRRLALAARYSWDNYLDAHLRLYQQVLDEN